MAVNKVDCKGGRLTLHGDYVVTHQEDVEFALEGDRIPNFLQGSKKGDIFLTTAKIIFVNKKPTGLDYESFSMPFQYVRNIEVKQPLFGANYLKGYVMAEPGGGWEGSANFKATFSSGGAIEFSEQLQRAVGEAQRRRYSGAPPPGQCPPGLCHPPPPLGGYYYPPYNSAYPTGNGHVTEVPYSGYQPPYAPPAQGAPPPYPGAVPPSSNIYGSDSDDRTAGIHHYQRGAQAKAREAYSSGPNVYVPAPHEAPPPYAPGYDKKDQ